MLFGAGQSPHLLGCSAGVIIERTPLEIAAAILAATAFIVKMCQASIEAARVINEATFLYLAPSRSGTHPVVRCAQSPDTQKPGGAT